MFILFRSLPSSEHFSAKPKTPSPQLLEHKLNRPSMFSFFSDKLTTSTPYFSSKQQVAKTPTLSLSLHPQITSPSHHLDPHSLSTPSSLFRQPNTIENNLQTPLFTPFPVKINGELWNYELKPLTTHVFPIVRCNQQLRRESQSSNEPEQHKNTPSSFPFTIFLSFCRLSTVLSSAKPKSN